MAPRPEAPYFRLLIARCDSFSADTVDLGRLRRNRFHSQPYP